MLRACLLGPAWFIVIYATTSFLVGLLPLVFMPTASAAAVRAINRQIFDSYGVAMIVASLVVAVIGTVTGFLPGTKRIPPDD